MNVTEAGASASRLQYWAFLLLGLFVCGAGAFVGGVFGLAGSGMYRSSDAAGPMMAGRVLGGAGGLLAGVIWSWKMVPWALRVRLARLGGGTLVMRGLVWGIYVGLGCTVLLHAGLMMVVGLPGLMALPVLMAMGICLAVGAIAGLLTGVLCGVLALILAVATRPRP